jgi:alanine-synthesizing transaminase
MFVWGKYPEPWSSQMNSVDFAMYMLEHANVALSPGTGFGAAGEGFCRMALVENENRLRQALRQMSRCLERDSRPATAEKSTQPTANSAVVVTG